MPQIKAVIGADTRQFDAAMKKAQQSISGFGQITKNMMGGLAAYFTGSAVLSFFDDAAKKYDQQVQSESRVAQAIKSTGGAAELTAKSLYDTASALQGISTYGDEDILANVTTNLLTFTNVSGQVFKDAQQAILDISTVLRQDLQSSTIQVGKALNDPIQGITALRRVGVAFTDDQKNVITQLVKTGQTAEAQKIILQELNKEFGGQAAAAAKVGLGAVKQFDNAWGDLKENIGSYYVPALAALAKVAVEAFQKLSVGRADAPKQESGYEDQIQGEVNKYVEADAEGRKIILQNWEKAQKEYFAKWQKAKAEEKSAEQAHYAERYTMVRDTQKGIEAFEKEAADAKKKIDKEQADAYTKEHGLINDIETELKALNEAKAQAYSVDQIKKINRQIEALESEKKMYESLTDSISQMERKQGMSISEVMTTLGDRASDQAQPGIDARMQPREIPNPAPLMTSWSEEMTGLIDISNELNNAVSSAFANMASGVGESIGQLIAGTGSVDDVFTGLLVMLADFTKSLGESLIAAGFASAAFKTLFANPLAAIAAGTALIALATVVKSKLQEGPGGEPRKFADGGLIFGPTLGLMGEYAGASRNPEVVAPLDRLQSMLGGGNNDVTVHGMLVGSDLLLSNSRAAARRSRIRAGR